MYIYGKLCFSGLVLLLGLCCSFLRFFSNPPSVRCRRRFHSVQDRAPRHPYSFPIFLRFLQSEMDAVYRYIGLPTRVLILLVSFQTLQVFVEDSGRALPGSLFRVDPYRSFFPLLGFFLEESLLFSVHTCSLLLCLSYLICFSPKDSQLCAFRLLFVPSFPGSNFLFPSGDLKEAVGFQFPNRGTSI